MEIIQMEHLDFFFGGRESLINVKLGAGENSLEKGSFNVVATLLYFYHSNFAFLEH